MKLAHSILVLSVALAACGSPPPPKTVDPPKEPEPDKPGLQMHGEFGVLDEAQVRTTFETVWRGAMTQCQKNAGEFVFGQTMVRMRVGHSGNVKWVYFKETNLGDRAAEKCMLDALRNANWPIPEGGDDGLAEQELPFADYSDRPPTEWGPDRARDTVDSASAKLRECIQGTSGQFVATAIIEKSGAVRSVGIQQPDETADEAADCLAETIKELKFPTTGSWPAKVTFDVP